jgi:hypothetical protein
MGTQLGPIKYLFRSMSQGAKKKIQFIDFLVVRCPPNCALGTQLSGHSILFLKEKKRFFT